MDAVSKAEGIVLRQKGEGVERKFPGRGGEISKNPQCSLASGKFRNCSWRFLFCFVFNDLSMTLSLWVCSMFLMAFVHDVYQ